MTSPNPRNRRIFSPESAPLVRKLDCRLQGDCLSRAWRENWAGLSCESCGVEAPLTDTEKKADAEGMARMWAHAPRLSPVRLVG